jgi:8-oxo-dGTP pyrophosphatase MutT (NUDIX family)
MNSLLNQRFHVGVYGILINENKVLLIKKSRGAYKGMFDLPGGSIEFGEKVEDALKREFIEETGVVLKDYIFIGHNEHFCDYLNKSNEPRKLHHLGLYYNVSASFDKIKTDPDGQDSLGAEFIEIANLDKIKISPIARPMIEKAINKNI